MKNITGKYLLLSYSKIERDKTRVAGTAHPALDENYYLLRLRILPTLRFYLLQDKRDPKKYLIFSGMSKINGKSRFYYQVGDGEVSFREDMIELRFPDLNQTYYMQMDSHDYSNSNAAA